MSLKFSLVLAVSLVAAPALAQDAGNPAPVEAKEKKVCRRVTPTGSIVAKSVCHTKAEWKQIEEENSRNTEAFRNRGKGRPTDLE